MKRKKVLAMLLSLVVASTCFVGIPASAESVRTVKLLCIGDSLTDEGSGTDENGEITSAYRYYLYRELNNAGLDMQFVGPKISNDPNLPAGSGHAGYAGHTLSPNYPFSVTNYLNDILNREFDVVLIMLGRNDSAYGYESEFYANYVNFLNRIYEKNPDAIVYCASVPKLRHWMADTYDWNEYDTAIQFHEQIERLVAQFRSAGKNVNFVDMDPEATGLTPL